MIIFPCDLKIWWQSGVTVRKRQIRVKIDNFLSRVTLKFDRWPWKTIGQLFYSTSSFVHHFIAICEFKMELQSGNTKFGSNRRFFVPYDLEIWRMTLKNYSLETAKLGFDLSDLDLWPFAWISLLSLGITPEYFMMIRWWEHSENVTDGRTDGRTESVLSTLTLLGRS